MELVRVTEAASVAAARWLGRGDPRGADAAATGAMRRVFDTIAMRGMVVIGEGERDEAPMLYIGEEVGAGGSLAVDVAVDPLEGTNIVAHGKGSALAVVAISDRGNLLHAPDVYMQKLAVGPSAKGKVSLDAPVGETIRIVAESGDKAVEDVVVVILDRPRHRELIAEVRSVGARIKLISDGDVVAAIHTGFPATGVDLLLGTGGAPEGVLGAVALRCLGGELQGRLVLDGEAQRERCRSMGLERPEDVLYMDDMVAGDDAIFAATGVTDGELLKGVRHLGTTVETNSVVMRAKTGTIRFIQGLHRLNMKS